MLQTSRSRGFCLGVFFGVYRKPLARIRLPPARKLENAIARALWSRVSVVPLSLKNRQLNHVRKLCS